MLSLKPAGENNSNVTLLTPDKGIIYATLYGGPKSKLKSLVSLYNCGTIWLYESPEKNQIKISDFDVKNFHSSLSQNLFKIYAASLAAELSIKTHAAGSSQECYKYVCGFLDGMELCNEEQSRLGLIRFLWRFLILLGVNPDVRECENCNKSFIDLKFDMKEFSYYNILDNTFLCKDCANSNFNMMDENNSFLLPLKLQSIRYLDALNTKNPKEVRQIKIDQESYEEIRQLVFYLIEKNVESKLNSIETGAGIL